jgi:hypothetical protein
MAKPPNTAKHCNELDQAWQCRQILAYAVSFPIMGSHIRLSLSRRSIHITRFKIRALLGAFFFVFPGFLAMTNE